MRYGFYLPTRGPTADPDSLVAMVAEAERLSFDSTVIADHVVFPATVESRYPYTVGGEFPERQKPSSSSRSWPLSPAGHPACG